MELKMYYTQVRIGDRNYSGIADRFNRKSDWHELARLNNFKMVHAGDRVRLPDSWVNSGRRSVPAVFQGQVAGTSVPNSMQGSPSRQFGVGQTENAIDQKQCLASFDTLRTADNPIWTALVAKYGEESAKKRYDIIARASCSDNEMMIHIPWLLLAGSAAVGALLGVGVTFGTMKLMER